MKTDTRSKKEQLSTATSEVIKFISLEDLLPNPYQPASRIQVDPETAKKFGLSIQEHGLIQTPVVRPGKEDSKYEIGDGWLRRSGFLYLAGNLQDSSYNKMPCVVRDLTDQQMADMVMEANTVRKDLNPIELAMFYKRYVEDFKVSQVELAKRHNCSQGEIANTIRLLELPADIQEKIISQEITETHGRQLLRLNYNTELQQSILKETVEKGISVNELSNRIASQRYWSSEDMDPGSYRKPIFDTKECESCPNHQKLGDPYDSKKKSWRCLDKACYKRKEDQVEKERVDKLAAEIAAARAEADKGKGKGKGKKGEAAVIDCTSNKLTWRDYQELGKEYHNIDDPGQCKTCTHRTLGAFYDGKTRPICVNVKCFKEKEKAYATKEAVKTREAERQLTEQVKAVCDKVNDETILFKVITDYLLAHCRKDTRERFAKMYGITDIKLFLAEYFASSDRANVLQKLAALVLQMERYEGEKGMFKKMLAYLDGTGDEIEKQITAFREAHCKGCRNDKDDGGCRVLMRVYTEGKCYAYWKKSKEEVEKETDDDTTKAGKSEDKVPKDSLPCKDCQNAPTCDRTFFYADGQGCLTCDNKVSAGAREEVPSEV